MTAGKTAKGFFMNKKIFFLGMLVMVLAFGMVVVGCPSEEEIPYSQEISVSVRNSATWDSGTPTTGQVTIAFLTPVEVVSSGKKYVGEPPKITVDDLQWLQASGIDLSLYNANSRTLTITSIEKTGESDEKRAFVKLYLTRSAVPPTNDAGTATISITFPNEFKAKYPDGISWGGRTFSF
jgi:hypothetical protein